MILGVERREHTCTRARMCTHTRAHTHTTPWRPSSWKEQHREGSRGSGCRRGRGSGEVLGLRGIFMATGNRSGAQTRMRDRKPMGKSLAKRSKDGHNYSGRGIQREKKRSALKNTRIDVRRGGRVSETGEKSWEPKSETPSGGFLTAKSSRQEAILHMGSELAPTTHLSTGGGSVESLTLH